MSHTPTRRPAASQVRVNVNARGTMIAASITDVGPAANGFVRGDRVAYPLSFGDSAVLDVDSLIGIPRNVTDWQAADLLAPGLVARAMITRIRPFFRGERVSVQLGNRMLRAVVSAMVVAQGGLLVDSQADAAVIYDDTLVQPSTVEASHRHGRLQESATEVFQAIRNGVFDAVPLGDHHPERVAA